MKKSLLALLLALLLAVIVAAIAASTTSAAVGDVTVPMPGGTLYFNTAGTSHFDFGSTVPVAQSWAGQSWDSVTADWQNVRVHDLVCVDLTLKIPTPGDYGVHCASFDFPITSDTITDVGLNPTSNSFDLSAAGMGAFPTPDEASWGGSNPDPSLLGALPDLDPYVGQTLTGYFEVRAESWAYEGTWPSGQNVTTLGYFGTGVDVSGTAAARSLASTGGAPKPPTWKGRKFTIKVLPTASDCHVPALRGKAVRTARHLLREHNCRALIRYKHTTRMRGMRGKVLRAGAFAGRWLPRHHRVTLIVGK